MKAKHLIEGASYGPEALKIICQAFEEAWTSIAGNFGLIRSHRSSAPEARQHHLEFPA